MGIERKAITAKLVSENSAWLDAEVSRLNDALWPLEVSKSGVLNALVSMARAGEIQLPLGLVQGLPSLPSTPNLAIDAASHGTVYCSREGSASQELPISMGAEPRKAVLPVSSSDGNTAGYPSLAIETAPIPLPKKAAR